MQGLGEILLHPGETDMKNQGACLYILSPVSCSGQSMQLRQRVSEKPPLPEGRQTCKRRRPKACYLKQENVEGNKTQKEEETGGLRVRPPDSSTVSGNSGTVYPLTRIVLYVAV